MIPAAIVKAADAGGWHLPGLQYRRRGDVMITLHRTGTNMVVDILYDRFRHTKARAYRGSALSALLVGQQAVVDYLEAT